mmetsp:Transcript_25378/g.24995  ORF Transcript_25378/g.24995 Transcript_25378/m.24995 type:complete len:99 (+) Transcript_25378:9-305(+)
MWCNFTQRAEFCNHPGCHVSAQGNNFLNFSMQATEEEQLARMLLYQNSLLTQVAANSNQINKCLDRLIDCTQNMAHITPQPDPIEISTNNFSTEQLFQ